MSAIDPWDAVEIRTLEEKIRYGTLTDEERNDSISIMGRKAALDIDYGRALGVRHVDRVKVAGNLSYRLTALAADGNTSGKTMTSNEVNPMKRTRDPERPSGLRAEVRPEGVALFWEEPPGVSDTPVVSYRVARGGTSGRSPALTRKPVVPNPHPMIGDPKFLDADPRLETLVYQVQSVDIFSRTSSPIKVKVDEIKLLARSRSQASKPAAKAEASPRAAPPPAGTPARAEAPPPTAAKASLPEIPSPERSAAVSPPAKQDVSALPETAVAHVPAPQPLSLPPDTDLQPAPEENSHIDIYRRALKDKDIGLPVKLPSPPKSGATPPKSVPTDAAPADLPRDPEEEARIAEYRKMAEDKELGLTFAAPVSPESRIAPPEPTPPRPAVADPPRDPEEEARIAEYRRMAEDKTRGIEETASPATTPGRVVH